MDDRGRLARPLKRRRSGLWPAAVRAGLHVLIFAARLLVALPRLLAQWRRTSGPRLPHQPRGLRQRLRRLFPYWPSRLLGRRLPRYAGLNASIIIVIGSVTYGVALGGHWPLVIEAVNDAKNAAANASGFHVTAVAISGHKHVSREDILASLGITDRTSLLFFDAEVARQKLKNNPWIADATVLKLYPDRLQITLQEREAFALWQKEGKIYVVAGDGTVVEPFVKGRITGLPLVVGPGAETRGREFLTLLDRFPEVRDQLRAAILVAERRWNLRLKSGITVRLPESHPEQALATLIALDRDKRLLSRDITGIDLRLTDRISVRLSEDAAQARNEILKGKAKKKGGEA
jgi:cell division protein FtsQ